MDNGKEMLDKAIAAVDQYMIEHGFNPVRMPDTNINLDKHMLMFKCQKKDCGAPYECIIVTGLEIHNAVNSVDFFLIRAKEKIDVHNHKKD